eukprot:8842212-Alexandrium_andersonii.AAC.1
MQKLSGDPLVANGCVGVGVCPEESSGRGRAPRAHFVCKRSRPKMVSRSSVLFSIGKTFHTDEAPQGE